jgi:Thioesterase-like superfamily
MSAKDDLFRDFPGIVTQAVLWGEMDSYQHVNNVAYFRYFENGRLEYIRRVGWFDAGAGWRSAGCWRATSRWRWRAIGK